MLLNSYVILFTVIIFILFALFAINIKIVPQSKVCVIERLGKYHKVYGPGVHIKTPFIDKIVKMVPLGEQTVNIPLQIAITKDNFTVQVNSAVFFQVIDAKLFYYNAKASCATIESLYATTLRSIIGELPLDQALISKDSVNVKITRVMGDAAVPWGIKINYIEIKDISSR